MQILDTNPQLFFHLQQQRLIELIRNGKVDEALEFAQEELAPRGEENVILSFLWQYFDHLSLDIIVLLWKPYVTLKQLISDLWGVYEIGLLCQIWRLVFLELEIGNLLLPCFSIESVLFALPWWSCPGLSKSGGFAAKLFGRVGEDSGTVSIWRFLQLPCWRTFGHITALEDCKWSECSHPHKPESWKGLVFFPSEYTVSWTSSLFLIMCASQRVLYLTAWQSLIWDFGSSLLVWLFHLFIIVSSFTCFLLLGIFPFLSTARFGFLGILMRKGITVDRMVNWAQQS